MITVTKLHPYTLLILVMCLLTTFFGQLAAQEPLKSGTTAAPFLEFGVDARGIAMGDAYVATAEGAAGAWWNPSGIGMMNEIDVVFMNMNYVADIKLQNLALAVPIPGVISFGLMFTSLDIPDDKVRTVEDPEGLRGESFEARSLALEFLVARKFTERFSIGAGIKFIHEKISQETATAFAFDAGVLFKTNFLNQMTLGMSITNFGSKLKFEGPELLRQISDRPDIAGTNQNLPANFDTGSWPLPITFRIGAATNVLETRNQRLRVAVDALHPNNASEYVNVGGEYSVTIGRVGDFSLRGGYATAFQTDSQQGLTLGAGLNIFVNTNFSIYFDYAFADYEFFGDVHRYSIGFKL